MKAWSPLRAAVMTCVLAGAAACGDAPAPTGPTPTPAVTQAPAPALTRYFVSGIVTSETGTPMANARVEIDFLPPTGRSAWVQGATDGHGRYALSFETTGPLTNFGVTRAADIFAWAGGHDYHVQFLPITPTTIDKTMVIRPAVTVTAGESATVLVDSISSICSDLEDWFIPKQNCGQIHIVAPADGTLVVDARPLQNAGAIATVFSATTGFYRGQALGPGTVTLREVRAGQTYHIYVGKPEGIASEQYAVTSSVKPLPVS